MNKIYRPVFVTYILLVINILVYVAQYKLDINLNEALEALDWGVNFAPYTLNNESWRLVSSMFIHFNLFHLIANMYTLFILGKSLEKEIGPLMFTIVYFTSGIVGSLFSIYWNLYVFSAGASGALFGIYAFDIILLLKKNREDKSALQSIIINFLIYLALTTLLGSRFRFDNACHFGGVIAGATLSAGYIFLEEHNWQIKSALIGALSILLIAFTGWVTPNYQLKYFDAFQSFLLAENETKTAFNANHSDQVLKTELIKITHLFDSTLELIDTIEYLPEEISYDADLLRIVSKARKREFNHVYNIIDNESYIYFDSIWYERGSINNLPRLNFPLNLLPNTEQDTTKKEKGNFFPTKEYYDEDWRVTTANNAEYWREGIKDSLGRWNGPVTDFYANGQIQMKGVYKKDIKEGVFIYYHENGKYDGAGRVKDDFNVGKWEYFNEDGQMEREVRYDGRYYLINAWDELGLPTVEMGNGEIRERYDNGITSSYTKYKDGLIDSLSFGNYENGLPHFKEWFSNGTLTNGIAYSETGERSNYDFSTYIPHPVGGGDKLFEYINSEKEKLELQPSDTANVRIVFNVFADGRPDNIRVLYTDNKRLINFCKHVIANGPDWFPAKDHGLEVVNAQTSVKISFP